MPFSEKQREYLDNADRRWNFKTGATRSGKTYLDFENDIGTVTGNVTTNTGGGS